MAIIAQDSSSIPKLLKVDTDDDNIAAAQVVQIVINLNYVWDAGATKWVRMTQPT